MNITEMVATITRWSDADFADIDAAVARDFPHASDAEIDRALEMAATKLRERGRQNLEHAEELRSLAALVADVPNSEAKTLGDKLRIKAARGDRAAQEALDALANLRESEVIAGPWPSTT